MFPKGVYKDTVDALVQACVVFDGQAMRPPAEQAAGGMSSY